MVNLKRNTVLLMVMLLLLSRTVSAQYVSIDQAKVVAHNWIATVINARGTWGGSSRASVDEVTEIKRGDRVIGYFCKVAPRGYIALSLLEGLAPIKSFSETSNLDPASNEGPADLLKYQLERRLDAIEQQLGPILTVKAADLDGLLNLNYTDVYRRLLTSPLQTGNVPEPDGRKDDYQEGLALLSSAWHQGYPYFILCPVPPEGSGCENAHCAVGCTATAGAQIMRYWSWPPGRPWLDMPDAMNIDPTPAEITAVSELSYSVGLGVLMQYCTDGCSSTGLQEDMADYFGTSQYNPLSPIVFRYQYEWYEWYDMIKVNLNQNRPMHYGIRKHAIVCDGWWSLEMPMYHMNYGWGNSYNAWYVFDDLYQVGDGTPANESMIHEIYPACAIGPSVSGTIPANHSYPYRYVDRDCSAGSAHFEAGQLIQFLPFMRMTCTSGTLRFDGTPALNTRLYTGEISRGMVVRNGQLVIRAGGGVKLGLFRRD